MAEDKNLVKFKSMILINIGAAYKEIGDYEKAIEYILNAIKNFEEQGNKKMIAICYSNLGNLFIETKEFNKSLEYSNNALKLYIELKNTRGQSICYINIGEVYLLQEKFNEALLCFNKSIKLYKMNNDLDGISASYNYIGSVYFELGKYDTANENFNKALEIKKQIGNKSGIGRCYYKKALLYSKLKDYLMAEKYLIESIEFFRQSNELAHLQKSLDELSFIYNITGKYQKAYNMHIEATSFKDSLFNIEKVKKIAHLEEKYLNEKQIQALEYENNIKTIKIKHHKKVHIIYITGLLFTLITLILILILLRKKNMSYKFLVSKNLDVLSKEKELKKVKEKLQFCDTCPQNVVSDNKKEKIVEKLEKLLDNEKIYIKPDLTLNKLAKRLSTNRVYLSQVINEELGKNFNDFINHYRVKEVMLMLSDPKINTKYSIETIARESGFNSKSSFNMYFKKYTGITPSNFKNNINGL